MFIKYSIIGVGVLLTIITSIMSKNRISKFFIISLSILLVVLSCIDAYKSNKSDELNKSKIDSLITSNKDLSISVEKINQYLNVLDSIGIKRDTLRNLPIISPKFYNKIEYVKELNQY